MRRRSEAGASRLYHGQGTDAAHLPILNGGCDEGRITPQRQQKTPEPASHSSI